MPVAVGIDLGTTYSAVAALIRGKVEVIANDFGQRTTPSCVAFVDGEAGELLGEAALRQGARNPTNTVFDAKRLIGRSWNEQSVQDDIKCWPFKVDNDGGRPAIHVVHNGADKKLSPHEVSAMVLRKLKGVAEGLLGEPVTEAVITVPAYFSDSQRRATREAGELAGLRVLRLVPEPTAAALAYALEQRFEAERTVLVYDLGGGTFDVSVVRINGRRVDVQAVGGNAHLGGLDVDQLILDFAADEIKRKLGRDVRDDAKRMRRLLAKCELAKRDLSVLTKAVINVMDVVGEDEEVFLHRARLEEMCRGLLNRTADTVKTTLDSAKLAAADIDEVILVGGSTRMPCVERLLTRLFPGKPLCKSINPDESVAYGAALWAAFLAGNDAAFLEGLEVQSVVPLSIGVDSWEGEFCIFIPRNTPIPVRKEIPYVTLYNNQSTLTLKVYQGERLVADRNKFIGKFVVEHIPPAPAGLKLDVALALDDDGILSVQAKLAGSIQWQGCVMRLDDVASTVVASNLEDAQRFLREDEEEVQRIRARFALSTALRNERGEVPEKSQPKVREIQTWFESRKRTESTRDFEDKLASFKKMKS